MSGLTPVGTTIPASPVGRRPGKVAAQVEAWVPDLMAQPGIWFLAEELDTGLYNRTQSLRNKFNEREEAGRFKVACRKGEGKNEEGVWDGGGKLFVVYYSPEQVEAGEDNDAPVEAPAEAPVADAAPEPVTI